MNFNNSIFSISIHLSVRSPDWKASQSPSRSWPGPPLSLHPRPTTRALKYFLFISHFFTHYPCLSLRFVYFSLFDSDNVPFRHSWYKSLSNAKYIVILQDWIDIWKLDFWSTLNFFSYNFTMQCAQVELPLKNIFPHMWNLNLDWSGQFRRRWKSA